jgi:hypothetical protein
MSYYYEWSMKKLDETLDELEHMILLIDKKKLRTQLGDKYNEVFSELTYIKKYLDLEKNFSLMSPTISCAERSEALMQ